MQWIVKAWASASDNVRIAIVVAVAVVLLAAIVYGVDVSALLGL